MSASAIYFNWCYNGRIMKFLVNCFLIITISGCADSIPFSIVENVQTVGFGMAYGME